MGRRFHTIDQLRRTAKARTPRFAFDFIDGGAGTEMGLAENEAALRRVKLIPRVLTGCEQRSTAAELFGRQYSLPIALAPIGMAGVGWPGAERGMAQAAAAADVPYILSTAACLSIEDAAAEAGEVFWFQLYAGKDPAMVDDLVDRADASGAQALILTVDVPVGGKRLRDLKNKFILPLRPSLAMAWDVVSHPEWSLATLQAGAPRFANMERYSEKGAKASSLAELMSAQSSARIDWTFLAELRRRWDRRLIVKGVMHPKDARRIVEAGADAVIVSNHGGRQLDASPAPIDMLPLVRAAVGPDATVMVDGGFRSGEDVAKALVLGADMVLLGRAFCYGVGALGPRKGPEEVIRIIREELDRAMALLGCHDLRGLGAERHRA
jgi:isopentenyl diphosphate isomerase/L-lactate dehydrogenase-like FMN-dependent dehydrogenase